MEQEKALNLFEKINKVVEEVEIVAKKLVVSTGKGNSYKAVSEKDVKEVVRKAEIKNGIVSIPTYETVKNNEPENYIDNYNKERTRFRIEMICHLTIYDINKPNEKITISSYGTGIDASDKGCGKAMAYSLKYALMSAYKIPTGDDPDFDPSKETKMKIEKKKQEEKLKKEQTNNNTKISKAQKQNLLLVAQEKGKADDLIEMLKKANCKTIEDLSITLYNRILEV